MAPLRRAPVVLGTLVLFAAGDARAHALGTSRFDAPVPLPLVLAGAGFTVAATAVLLALTVDPGERRERGTVLVAPASVARALRVVARVGFLALFVASVVVGLTGRQVPGNLATVFAWGVWLKGVAIVAVVLGDPWGVLSPWRTAYEALCRLEGDDVALARYPRELGSWPAVGWFLLGVGVLENLTVVPRAPRLTALVLVGYATVMLVGGVAFGREWFVRADALAVLYRLFGRVAPLRWPRTDDGGYGVTGHAPWRTGAPLRDGSLVAFVVVALYTVSFDAFTATRTFQTLSVAVRGLLDVGGVAAVLLYAVGAVLFLAGFALVARLTARVTGESARRTALVVAPTLLPIAAAYEVAHTYPFVVRQSATLVELGAAAAGIALSLDPLAWLSLPAFWGSQVALVVAGHVVAVVAAHGTLVERPAASHLPLTVLMVGYTVLSLWVVSRPVVA